MAGTCTYGKVTTVAVRVHDVHSPVFVQSDQYKADPDRRT